MGLINQALAVFFHYIYMCSHLFLDPGIERCLVSGSDRWAYDYRQSVYGGAASFDGQTVIVEHRYRDAGTDEVTRLVAALFQTLVPNSHHFHLHRSSGKFQLNVQLPIRPGKIMFADAYGGSDQGEARATDVESVTAERGETP